MICRESPVLQLPHIATLGDRDGRGPGLPFVLMTVDGSAEDPPSRHRFCGKPDADQNQCRSKCKMLLECICLSEFLSFKGGYDPPHI